MKYYLIAGEPSGDLHGSNLMKGLKKADPEAEFRFWGGDMMSAAGGAENLVRHYKQMSFFGFVQIAANIGTIMRQIGDCRRDIKRWQPDVVILVDYPGFNMRIARFAHEHGIRVFYYIAPKAWAWKEHRVKSLRRYVDRLYVIFPFEREWFGRRGVESVFCGNPLTDALACRLPSALSGEEFRRRHGLDGRPIIALLSGSRRTEIEKNLPDMVALAERMPDRQFVVAGVPWVDERTYDRIVGDSGVRRVCDATYELLSVSEAAVVTSGTATLETALIGVPEMVVYRIPWLYEKLRPLLLRTPWVSLVNINLGRECVREYVTSHFDAASASEHLRTLLTDGRERERMLAEFGELRAMMGSAGAGERAAASMAEELENRKQRER